MSEVLGLTIARKWTLHQNSSFQVWYSENSSSECNWDQLTVLILSVILVEFYPMDPYCGCAHSWILYYNKSNIDFNLFFHCICCFSYLTFPPSHRSGHVLPLITNVNSRFLSSLSRCVLNSWKIWSRHQDQLLPIVRFPNTSHIEDICDRLIVRVKVTYNWYQMMPVKGKVSNGSLRSNRDCHSFCIFELRSRTSCTASLWLTSVHL